MRRIPWVAEQLLSSQDRLRSMEFVSNDVVGSWDYTASNGLWVTLCMKKTILRSHLSCYSGNCSERLNKQWNGFIRIASSRAECWNGISRIWSRNSKYSTSMSSCINYSNSSSYIYQNKETFEISKSEISSVECILWPVGVKRSKDQDRNVIFRMSNQYRLYQQQQQFSTQFVNAVGIEISDHICRW